MVVSVIVNGARHERDVEPRLLLSDFLRQELRLTGTHVGCEHGVCGACTILFDGEPVRSCLALAVQALPPSSTWAAAGIGRFQFQTNALAVTMGGHVRVGLEDNLFMDAGRTEAATNASLVRRIVTLARAAGRAPATPDEARRIIGLPPRDGPSS